MKIEPDKKKRPYSIPQLECVELDNEISLILQSLSPEEIPEGDPE